MAMTAAMTAAMGDSGSADGQGTDQQGDSGNVTVHKATLARTPQVWGPITMTPLSVS
ncbi:hypothetical protein D9M71_649650 [compost metagenome]